RYRLRGRLSATLTQECVVTLEPISQSVTEAFDIEFWPTDTLPDAGDDEVEVLSIPDVEPIAHGRMEVGHVIFEVLATSMNPFPRKGDASLEWQDAAASSEDHPGGAFAALSKLKK